MVVYLMICSFKFVFINFIGAHVVIVSVTDLYFKQSVFLHFFNSTLDVLLLDICILKVY